VAGEAVKAHEDKPSQLAAKDHHSLTSKKKKNQKETKKITNGKEKKLKSS